MKRVIWIILDSVGMGEQPDARPDSVMLAPIHSHMSGSIIMDLKSLI